MSGPVKRLLPICLSIIVLLPVIVLLINTSPFDQTLDPEAARLLTTTAPPAARDSDNAYYALMGIYSAISSDPNAAGWQQVEQFNTTGVVTEAQGIHAAEFDVDGLGSCDRSMAASCLQTIEQNQARIEQLAGQYRPYLQRYERLLDSHRFRETVIADFRAPLLPNVQPLERVFVAASYLEKRDRPDVLLAVLNANLRFQRLLLVKSDSLTTKMQSARSILFATKMLSEYSAHHTLSDAQRKRVRDMLEPLSVEELDISEGFVREFRIIAKAVSDYAGGAVPDHVSSGFGGRIHRYLMQPKATINAAYNPLVRELIRLAAMPSREFRDAVAGIEKQNVAAPVCERSWSPYNYGGRAILSIAMPDFLTYIKTMHDLDGMIRLSQLQLDLKDNAEGGAVEQAIRASNIDDAYEVSYDEKIRRLSFVCYSRQSECAIAL